MKKTYIIPQVDIMVIEAVNVIAYSPLGTNESGSDGTQLSKGDNNWNIWDDDVE